MVRTRHGDADAFDELVSRYRGALVQFFENRLGNVEMALDLAQEVFVRLWLACDRYTPLGPFAGYLFTIAERLCLDEARRASRLPVTRSLDAEQAKVFDIEDPSPTPEAQVMQRCDRRRLWNAIRRLPERAQRVFYLSQIEGKKYADIAAELNIPVGTVKYYMWQAHRQLRNMVDG